MKESKELGKKNEGKEYKKKTNIDEKFRKFKDENMAYTNDRAKVVDKNKSETGKKQILFAKKSRFEGKLFYGTQPTNNFKNALEVYKNDELIMKQVKNLFKIGYTHIKPDNNIKLYNKMIKDFIDYYNLKVSNNK